MVCNHHPAAVWGGIENTAVAEWRACRPGSRCSRSLSAVLQVIEPFRSSGHLRDSRSYDVSKVANVDLITRRAKGGGGAVAARVARGSSACFGSLVLFAMTGAQGVWRGDEDEGERMAQGEVCMCVCSAFRVRAPTSTSSAAIRRSKRSV